MKIVPLRLAISLWLINPHNFLSHFNNITATYLLYYDNRNIQAHKILTLRNYGDSILDIRVNRDITNNSIVGSTSVTVLSSDGNSFW